jgi:hypothetical protein
MYSHGIPLDILRKPTKDPSQDNECPGQNFNQAPPEYKSRVLPLCQIAQFLGKTEQISYTVTSDQQL